MLLLFYFLQCLSSNFLLEPSSFSVTLSQRSFLWWTLPNSPPIIAGFRCSSHLSVLFGILNLKDMVTPSSFRVYILMVFQGLVSLLFPSEAFEPIRIYSPNFVSPHLWASCNTSGRCYHLYITLKIAKCIYRACLVEPFDLPDCVRVPSTWWFYPSYDCKHMGRKVINSCFPKLPLVEESTVHNGHSIFWISL